MTEFVFEFLGLDGKVVHSETREAMDPRVADAFARIGLINVLAYHIATSYRVRDAATGEIVAASDRDPSGG